MVGAAGTLAGRVACAVVDTLVVILGANEVRKGLRKFGGIWRFAIVADAAVRQRFSTAIICFGAIRWCNLQAEKWTSGLL